VKIVLVSLSILLVIALPVAGQDEVQPKDPTWPVILNLFPGFGIGSFVEGDGIGGLVQLLGEVSGFALELVAAASAFSFDRPPIVDEQTAEYLFYGGMALQMGARMVWGVARPIWFAGEYNAGRISFRVAPVVEPSAGSRRISVGMEMALQY
jgi:hypothetical protein